MLARMDQRVGSEKTKTLLLVNASATENVLNYATMHSIPTKKMPLCLLLIVLLGSVEGT